MNGFSKVFMVGYLGGNPELRRSKGGQSYTRLSIATHKSKKLENNTYKSSTHWHKVMVWGARAEMCVNKLSKGSIVVIEGSVESYKSEHEGGVVQQNVIVANNLQFFSNPKQQSMKTSDEESFAAIDSGAPEMSEISVSA